MNPQLQLMLQQAVQAFQNGNFESADLSLRRILQVDPKNLPALHILGLIKASQSDYKEAADYLARAVRIHPNDASLQYNLAKALSDSGNDKDAIAHHKKAVALDPNNPESWLSYGKTASNLCRYDDALACYDKALSLKPDYAEASLNKGATLKELARYEDALTFAEQALAINPNLAEAWSNKGGALKELKQYDKAIAAYDTALSLKPDYAEAWSNKGGALKELKQYDKAIAAYDTALSLKPDYAEAWTNKGVALQELKQYGEAIASYDMALSLKPEYAEAWTNKGVALQELKQYDEAIASFETALSLKPDYAQAWTNKGVTLQELKQYDEAIAHHDKALSLKPDYAEAWANKSMLNLFLKKYQDGWASYDWRIKIKDSQLKMAIKDLILWNGSSCKHLLILSEQGLGDIIFFASILKIVNSKVEAMTIAVDIRLIPTFSRSFPEVRFIDQNTPFDTSQYDAQIPFGSLPVLINMAPDMVGRKVPYILDNDVITKSLTNKLSPQKRLKCGVAWKSNNRKLGKNKSILLSDLNSIFQVEGYEFINLQYGDTQEEIVDLEKNYGSRLTTIEGIDLFKDVDGLLSIIQTCDLIVTTSNVTAHLAGALGKTTFLLVPYSAGRIWYWHEDIISSWYPSISLYSQDQNFEWSTAIKDISSKLKNEIYK